MLGAVPPALRGLAYDSRKVAPGELFVAIPGLKQDGRRFIGDALGRGAAAVVFDGPDVLAGSETGRVLVPSARQALARLADAYFGHPSRALTVVGITGTNGKTTTSILVDALLRARGRPTGLIGTIEYRIGEERLPASQTTPEALELQSLLARMVEAGVAGVAMEVSSHALALHRADGIEFDVAVFTNLTQDHLDFHVTLDAYRDAKARLFVLLAAGAKAAAHRGGQCRRSGGRGDGGRARRAACSPSGSAPRRRSVPRQYRSGMDGIRMDVDTPGGRLQIASPLVGEHNVMNLLGAIGVGLALGMDRAVIAAALAAVSAVPGRFERVEAGSPSSSSWTTRTRPTRSSACSPRARKLLTGGGRLARGLRLRGRSRSRQAADHGSDRGAARRPRVGHLGQPAERAARGHHRGDRRGHSRGRPRPPRRGARPARGDPRRADVGGGAATSW